MSVGLSVSMLSVRLLQSASIHMNGYRNRNRELEISTAPQKRSRGNQLILRRLSKTKSIGSESDPENQAGRQTIRRLWWMISGVETGR